jgi:hypothetical protein
LNAIKRTLFWDRAFCWGTPATGQALEAVNLETNSDNFLFDQEIIAEFIDSGVRICEVPVPARYFLEASSASFLQSSVYGLPILQLLAR